MGIILFGWPALAAFISGCILSFLLIFWLHISRSHTDDTDLDNWKANFQRLHTSYAKMATHANQLQEELKGLKKSFKASRLETQALKEQLYKKEQQAAGNAHQIASHQQRDTSRKRWQHLHNKANQLAEDKDRAEQMARRLHHTVSLLQKKLQAKKPLLDLSSANQNIPESNTIDNLSSLMNFRKRGKSSSDNKDDLRQIHGINKFIEKRLNELGISRFDQIASFGQKDIDELTTAIPLESNQIGQERWIEQAKKFK